MKLPDDKLIQDLHRKYAHNDELFELVFTHGKIVAEIALWCANNVKQPVDLELLRVTCLLHDIGSHIFINTPYREVYAQHAMFGSKILEEEGLAPEVYNAVQTHVLLGLTREDILERKLRLPAKDFVPQTIEARLLCYADRFHSKHPQFNSYNTLMNNFQKTIPKVAVEFEVWSNKFGIPDIETMAKKYGHPIR